MKFVHSILAASVMLALTHGASAASTFPDRPLTIVVPFTAGGIVDSVARIVGEPLSKMLGQPVIVENKSGAGGAIGTDFVRQAKPDGYTLLTVSPSHAVQPVLNKAARWDPVRDFRALAGAGYVPNLVVVPSSSPAKTLQELLDMAGADPGSITYGSAGLGTSNHLSGELLGQMAGVELTHVAYKGQPEAVTDLISGRISMMPLTTALASPLVADKKLRALAVTTKRRSSLYPELPTVAEAGKLPDYEVATWFGFVVPAGTPQDIRQKLSDSILEVLSTEEVRTRLTGLGMELDAQSGDMFDAYVASEFERWTDVMKKAGAAAN